MTGLDSVLMHINDNIASCSSVEVCVMLLYNEGEKSARQRK